MKQSKIVFLALVLFINQCVCQNGFPKQFQATINITTLNSWPVSSGLQNLLFDYTNLRARFDIEGWRLKQKETYLLIYEPPGAESGSVRKICFLHTVHVHFSEIFFVC